MVSILAASSVLAYSDLFCSGLFCSWLHLLGYLLLESRGNSWGLWSQRKLLRTYINPQLLSLRYDALFLFIEVGGSLNSVFVGSDRRLILVLCTSFVNFRSVSIPGVGVSVRNWTLSVVKGYGLFIRTVSGALSGWVVKIIIGSTF